jgi:hypothetical protein
MLRPIRFALNCGFFVYTSAQLATLTHIRAVHIRLEPDLPKPNYRGVFAFCVAPQPNSGLGSLTVEIYRYLSLSLSLSLSLTHTEPI